MMLGARAPLLEGGGEFPHAHKASPPRCCFWLASHVNVRKCVAGVMLLSILTIFFYTYYVTVPLTRLSYRNLGRFTHNWPVEYSCSPADKTEASRCQATHENDSLPSPPQETYNNDYLDSQRQAASKNDSPLVLVSALTVAQKNRSEVHIIAKALVIVESTESELGIDIAGQLLANNIQYKIYDPGNGFPVVTALTYDNYTVIVFESISQYANMDRSDRQLLDRHCKQRSIGVIGFATPGEEMTLTGAQANINLRLKDATLNALSPMLRLTRDGGGTRGPLPGECWTVFIVNTSSYEPVAWALQRNDNGTSEEQVSLPIVVLDNGRKDGVQKVFFGSGLQFWLHRLLFLDAISYLSNVQLSLNLDRWILIDIDNIFFKESGTRLPEEDVQALLASQAALQRLVPGFRFNLGFSAKYYHHGTMLENIGDDALLKHREHFTWYSQLHLLPHFYNVSQLEAEMIMNKQFAVDHGIPTNFSYSVTRHYSGIYPVHQPLYDAWKRVWDVKVTSTEEYPHYVRTHRGFQHDGVMVLPRQLSLEASVKGGILLQTIINNPISVFPTQLKNWESFDILESELFFLLQWTNVRLMTAPPLVLAEKYFQLRPDELNPIWENPCEDPRHRMIWSKYGLCLIQVLPKFLVVGPPKTGGTVLHTLLTIHPALSANLHHPETKEELQFFNDPNYFKGLDWYIEFFPWTLITPVARYTFEKSSTYFDDVMAPRRAHMLLPWTEIIAVLVSPAKRAYSWYQHIRSHGDPVANNYTFHTVITANDSAPKTLRDLRSQCLIPGEYSHHLDRWLAEYDDKQVHLVDGTFLRSDPVPVMDELQKSLKLIPRIHYNRLLKYEPTKGFCLRSNISVCISSNRQKFPEMEEQSARYLREYYTPHNTALSKLLVRLGRPVPPWLKDELSSNG